MKAGLRCLRSRTVLAPGIAMAVACAAMAGMAGPAAAAFTASSSAALGVASATLAPPTRLATTVTCGSKSASAIRLTWTATVSAWATGYSASLATDGGDSQPAGTVPAGSVSMTIPVSNHGSNHESYTISLRATYLTWTSTAATSSGSLSCR